MLNQLVKVYQGDIITENVYNADGLRVMQKLNDDTTRFMYDAGNVIAETDANGNLTGRNVYGIRLISRAADGKNYIYRFNGHGDVTAVTDASGAVVASYSYDPFGVELSSTSAMDNPYRYCGEYFDADTGLIYLRHRYYDPATGRFISEDPIRDGLNWYVYCANNPIVYVDPWGLDAIVLLNRNGAVSSTSDDFDGVPMGHMAIVVQNTDGNWYYFSCGEDYIALKPVNTNDLSDLKTFSEKYYWDDMYYTDATYIKGDFSNSYDYFKEYYDKNYDVNHDHNKTDHIVNINDDYSLIFNNCSTVVLSGLKKGVLNDGTKVSTFIITDTTYGNQLTGTPNSIMKALQKIFYNSEFTKEASHKTINDLLWEKQSGPFWKRNATIAGRLEKLY